MAVNFSHGNDSTLGWEVRKETLLTERGKLRPVRPLVGQLVERQLDDVMICQFVLCVDSDSCVWILHSKQQST